LSSASSAQAAAFELPDTIASLRRRAFEFSPGAADEAGAVVAAGPDEVFQRLLRDQESEATLLVARRVLHAFLGRPADDSAPPDFEAIAAEVAADRATIVASLGELDRIDPDVRETVLRQRAPLGLLAGCWLDVVSQPATQPSVIVNRLFSHHVRHLGEGNPQRGLHHTRRRALEAQGVWLPETGAADFLRKADARPLTALHGAFYLALSRLPASFLPEVVGVHYAFHALGVDDLLLGTEPMLPEHLLTEALTEYLALTERSPDGPSERSRLWAAIRLVRTLEREHVAMLAELASWRSGLPLDAQVAEIVARHAPFAGSQHRNVRMNGRSLADVLDDPAFDLAAFLQELRGSRHLRPGRGRESRFLNALRFGGPMFGIFDEREAATFRAWAEAGDESAGEPRPVELSPNTAGDAQAAAWRAAVERSEPGDVVLTGAGSRDDRELLHRLVNIEAFAATMPQARERALRGFADAEVLFDHGARGAYTDASYFDYSPQALLDRLETIYRDKIGSCAPLTEIPDRETVIFGQKTFALGNLIDGTWACRVGNVGRYGRQSDGMLFSIYADEMGYGDLRKNHITLIHQVLRSMSIRLPHIRDSAFLDQDELPDELYGFAVHQLCMSLFPDTFHNEILGYNLGVETFGLGETRLHEMQRLRHHGFDDAYEAVHLSIDNFSTGHARQAADIVISHLDGIARGFDDATVQAEWRRIWRGYASFAYFVEHRLVRAVQAEHADMVI